MAKQQCQAIRDNNEQCQITITTKVPLYLKRRGRPKATDICLCSNHAKKARSGDTLSLLTDAGFTSGTAAPPTERPGYKSSYVRKIGAPVTEVQPVKGRELNPGQYVRVYYNVNRACFSVQDALNKQVIAHVPRCSIRSAQFKVYETGRQRVIESGQKNVHAFVVGHFAGTDEPDTDGCRAGYYNPREVADFVDAETKEALTGLYPVVHCVDKAVLYKAATRPEVEISG